MNQKSAYDAYWMPAHQTYYGSYYQELLAEALLWYWKWIDILTVILVAATASTSAVAGWALWSEPGWKTLWVIIAGVAVLASIGHGAMGVPVRVRQQEKVRSQFCELRLALESFLHQLYAGVDAGEARERYGELRRKYELYVGENHPDILCTFRLSGRVKEHLNGTLREREYIR